MKSFLLSETPTPLCRELAKGKIPFLFQTDGSEESHGSKGNSFFLRGWVGLCLITIEDLGGGGISLEECIIELEKRIRAIKLAP